HASLQVKPSVARAKLQAVADTTDESAWRQKFRRAVLGKDAEQMKALAGRAEAREQPPAVLVWLGGALTDAGLAEEAAVLLRQAQQRHPDDFWINFDLAIILHHDVTPPHPVYVAVGYYRAALTIRPDSA